MLLHAPLLHTSVPLHTVPSSRLVAVIWLVAALQYVQLVTAASFAYQVEPIQQSTLLHAPLLHTSVPLHTVPSSRLVAAVWLVAALQYVQTVIATAFAYQVESM